MAVGAMVSNIMQRDKKFKNLDDFEPDWVLAKVHGRACRASKGRRRDHPSENGQFCYMLCQCCLKVVDKEPISVCANSKELEFLGFGFPLYFIFIKYVIMFLLLQCLNYATINLYWNAQANYDFCFLNHPRVVAQHILTCSSWLLDFASLNAQLFVEDLILRATSFTMQLLALIYIRDTLRKTYQYYDEKTNSLSDYTLMLRNIPTSHARIITRIHAFLSSRLKAITQRKSKPKGLSQVSVTSKSPTEKPIIFEVNSPLSRHSAVQMLPIAFQSPANFRHSKIYDSNYSPSVQSPSPKQNPINRYSEEDHVLNESIPSKIKVDNGKKTPNQFNSNKVAPVDFNPGKYVPQEYTLNKYTPNKENSNQYVKNKYVPQELINKKNQKKEIQDRYAANKFVPKKGVNKINANNNDIQDKQAQNAIYSRPNERLAKGSPLPTNRSTSQNAGSVNMSNPLVHPHFFDGQQSSDSLFKEVILSGGNGVEQIIPLNDIQQFYEYEERRAQLIEVKRNCLINAGKGIDNQKDIQEVNKELNAIEAYIEEFHSKLIEETREDKIQCEKAFVICSTETIAEDFIKDISALKATHFLPFFGEKCKLKVEEAPEPREIIWQNINRTKREQRWGQVKGWVGTVLVLAAVTVVFYFILQAKSQDVLKAVELASDEAGSQQALNAAIILTYFVIVAIVIFNKFILAALLHWFTEMELHQCTSDSEYSFALKYTIGLFFTTALMTLLVEDIGFHNIYTHKFGVVEQQSIMFFMNCFLVCVIWLINPWSIIKSLKRRYYMGEKTLTQRQANQVMEDVHYSMGKRYAQILESTWFTFLYASLIPGGVLLSCLGVIMFYWIDKFNLLRRSAVLQNVSGAMVLKALTLLQFTLVLRPAGELIFDIQMRGGYTIQSVVCLVIGFVYMVLPKNVILSWIHKEKFDVRNQTYEQVKNSFVEDYCTMHPLFSRGLKQRIQRTHNDGNPLLFVQSFRDKKRTLRKLPTIPFSQSDNSSENKSKQCPQSPKIVRTILQ